MNFANAKFGDVLRSTRDGSVYLVLRVVVKAVLSSTGPLKYSRTVVTATASTYHQSWEAAVMCIKGGDEWMVGGTVGLFYTLTEGFEGEWLDT